MKKIILSAALVTVAACGGGSDEVAITTPETTTTTEAPATTEATTTRAPAPTTTRVPEDDSIRQPLTGEIVESDDDVVTLPALAVKIDNNDSAARPNHSGLANADIVFEEIVEFGTRFAAVFHSEGADPIGPIRSGREQDVALLSSFNQPLFAWSGGNPGVTRLIRDSVLTDLNAGFSASGAYYRGPGRAPNNLYSSSEALYSFTPEEHPGAPVQQFVYQKPDEEFTGDPVESFEVELDNYDIRWDWDETEGRFARFQQGSRHVDVVNGDIFADNIVVMVVDYRPSSIDASSPNAQTVGSGPVFVFSNGSVITGRWERIDAESPLRFVDADGDDIALTAGNTWIELADNVGGDAFTTTVFDEVDPDTIPQIELDAPDEFPTAIQITAQSTDQASEE